MDPTENSPESVKDHTVEGFKEYLKNYAQQGSFENEESRKKLIDKGVFTADQIQKILDANLVAASDNPNPKSNEKGFHNLDQWEKAVSVVAAEIFAGEKLGQEAEETNEGIGTQPSLASRLVEVRKTLKATEISKDHLDQFSNTVPLEVLTKDSIDDEPKKVTEKLLSPPDSFQEAVVINQPANAEASRKQNLQTEAQITSEDDILVETPQDVLKAQIDQVSKMISDPEFSSLASSQGSSQLESMESSIASLVLDVGIEEAVRVVADYPEDVRNAIAEIIQNSLQLNDQEIKYFLDDLKDYGNSDS